MWLVHQDIFL